LASKLASLSVANPVSTKTAKQTFRSKSLKVLKLRYLLVGGVLGWAAFYYWHTQYPQLSKLQDQQNHLELQVATMQKQHDELVRQIQEFQNDAYVARYASEHFNLVLPGQVPFDVQH